MGISRSAWVGALAVLTLASCTADHRAAPDDSTTTTLGDVHPADRRRLVTGDQLDLFGVGSDGAVYLQDLDHSNGRCSGQIYIDEPSGPRRLFHLPEPVCVYNVAADATHIVWESDHDLMEHPEWSIWSYSRVTQKIVLLDSYESRGETSRLGPEEIHPRLDQGLVVWSTVVGDPPQAATFSAPVDGGEKPTLMIKGSSDADMSYPLVAYASLYADGGPPDLGVYDFNTRRAKIIGTLPEYGDLAIGNRTVYVASDVGVRAIDVDTGAVTVIQQGTKAQRIEATGDTVAWATEDASYVYVKGKGVTLLGTRPMASYVFLAGRTIMWSDNPAGEETTNENGLWFVATVPP